MTPYGPGWSSAGLSHDVHSLMKDESLVNGVWAGILSIYFPMPKYIIAPEYWTKPGERRGDLIVIHAKSKKTVFSFEGKKEKLSPQDWDKARVQILGYLGDGNSRVGQVGYGLLATGTEYAILCWNGSQLYRLGTSITDQHTDSNRQEINGRAVYIDKILRQIKENIEKLFG